MQTWIWQQLRVELPEDWEMLQYSPRREAGQCAFADRYQFRLVLQWRRVTAEPHLKRMMADYLAQLRARPDTADLARAQAGPWEAIRGRLRAVSAAWFRRYFPGLGCVAGVTLLWPGGVDEPLEEAILASVCEEGERAGGLRRWRAFGMDLLASADLELSSCRVQPARARLAFADARGRRQETFERLGMVAEWLKEPTRAWLSRQLPKGGIETSHAAAVVHEHEIDSITGRAPTRRWGGLITRPSAYEAAAWLCPSDGRLYHVCTTATEGSLGTRLAGQRLACCRALELTAS